MTLTSENVLLIAAILLFVSILITKMSSRFGVPTLLLFLIVGMCFGSDGLGIQFSSMKTAQFIGIIALSIILFSGGMDTKIADIKPVLAPGIVLSTIGVILTMLFTGSFLFVLIEYVKMTDLKFTLMFSLLLASTMASTDSASVFNLLRTQKIGLKHNLKPMLELESGSNDPMAFMLVLLFIGILQADAMTWWEIIIMFIIQFAVGLLAGYGFGKAAVWLINKIGLNNSSLYPILLLSFIFLTFTITDMIKGNGYLAVYIAGIIVGNHPLVKKIETTNFLDGLTWLFQIIMFLILGLLVNPHELIEIAPFALIIGAFMIFVARPLSIFISLAPFRNINARSKCFISWVGLRGASPIIFATYPVIAGIEGSNNLFNVVFFITLLSLIFQGATIPFVAKKLKLKDKMKKEGNDFGIVFPEEIGSKLWDVTVTWDMLINGNKLKDVGLPPGILVILIKRGDKHIIPGGMVELKLDDKLLLISAEDHNTEGELVPQK